MNDLQRKVDEMRNKDRARAEENRRRMPIVTAIVDECRAVFGADVVVKYASEGGVTLGSPGEPGIKLSETLVGSFNTKKK